ncbi:hypothetical protein L9F63_005300, partial [Diploptera punctata]
RLNVTKAEGLNGDCERGRINFVSKEVAHKTRISKTHQVLISRSPHLYMSPSSHCDDIKAMNNFLPSTLEYV